MFQPMLFCSGLSILIRRLLREKYIKLTKNRPCVCDVIWCLTNYKNFVQSQHFSLFNDHPKITNYNIKCLKGYGVKKWEKVDEG